MKTYKCTNEDLIGLLKSIEHLIGCTPFVQIVDQMNNVYAKLEYYNLYGSVKDRAAYYILLSALQEGIVNSKTVVVESSSGNFAIALASLCKFLGLHFIAVIDANTNSYTVKFLRATCFKVIKVREKDATGGYLLNRLKIVKGICGRNKNSFWPNQYENVNNYLAYYHGLGKEINAYFNHLDYVFISVSSCGTITGISRRLKEKFPGVKIIAVDVQGSMIFGNSPQLRLISGIGSSIIPKILDHALIDEVIHVSQSDIIKGCEELKNDKMLFVGASSGAAYYAAKHYFDNQPSSERKNVLFICPDRGNAYIDTIYNRTWVKRITHH